MKDHFLWHWNWTKTAWGNKKKLLARQSILQRRFLPMCQNAHSSCHTLGMTWWIPSQLPSAFSASATAAAHSLIWQHKTFGMNTDYWHLEWTPTLINTRLKVPLSAHPWAWWWPSQLSKDLQLQHTYQQHAPTTTPSITTKSLLRERLPSGIFLVWYMS